MSGGDARTTAAQDVPGRLMSLDALRGADMFLIIGGAGLVTALCKWLGFGADCWLADQMTHVMWHGFHQHDTIFPLFVFLAGAAWPFSYAKQRERGRTTGQVVRKILVRVFLLALLGVADARFFKFQFGSLRYDSILAHVGLCWGLAALLYVFVRSWKVRLAVAFGLLAVHWLVLFCFSAPDAAALLSSTDPVVAKLVKAYAPWGTGNFSFTGNIANWMDRMFVPNVSVWDPDGLFAKVSGMALASFGVLAGEWLRSSSASGNRKAQVLVGAGLGALVLCLVWSPLCPVNKKIWTSTFVLAAAVYSLFLLALFYWIIDVRGWRAWSFFFRVIGLNSITIYVMGRFMNFDKMSLFFFSGIADLGCELWGGVVFWFGVLTVEWLVLWHLYRQRIFLRV